MTIKKLNQEIRDLKEKLGKLNASNEGLENKLKCKTSEIKSIRLELEKNEKKFRLQQNQFQEKLKTKELTLKTTKQTCELKLKDQVEQIAKCKRELTKKAVEIQKKDELQQNLNSELKRAKIESSELEEKVQNGQKEINELKSESARKEKQTAEKITENQMKIKSLNLKNIFQKVANMYTTKNLRMQNRILESTTTSLKKEKGTLEEDLASKKGENSQLKRDYLDVSKEKKKVAEENQLLNKKLSEQKNEIKKLVLGDFHLISEDF